MKVSSFFRFSVVAVFSLVAFAPLANGAITFTYEAPGVQSTTVSGTTTEDFNDGSYAASGVGTFAGGSVQPASQFGGAGGTGFFLFSTQGSPTTLTFPIDQNYVGFWWSAGDAGNVVSFFDASNTLLSSFTVGTALSGLSSAYFGNPNPAFLGQNSGEAYAYLNFTNTGGPSIHSVVFGGSNFEVDNISTTAERITPPGIGVPEGGSTLCMAALALLACFAARAFKLLRAS